MKWVGEFLGYLVILVLALSLVRVFVAQPFTVPSGSMEHTIEVGDTILALKPGEPDRGDIIVFRDDLGWLGSVDSVPWWDKILPFLGLAAPKDAQYLVKRLIGLPGDRVTCCDAKGRISVNGYPLDEQTYLYTNPSIGQVAPSQFTFDIVVPSGEIFVMGDHRDESKDSRLHMCDPQGIPTPNLVFPTIASIQGKVVAVTRPLSRMHTFSTPDFFSDIPEATGSPPSPNVVQWTCPVPMIGP